MTYFGADIDIESVVFTRVEELHSQGKTRSDAESVVKKEISGSNFIASQDDKVFAFETLVSALTDIYGLPGPSFQPSDPVVMIKSSVSERYKAGMWATFSPAEAAHVNYLKNEVTQLKTSGKSRDLASNYMYTGINLTDYPDDKILVSLLIDEIYGKKQSAFPVVAVLALAAGIIVLSGKG